MEQTKDDFSKVLKKTKRKRKLLTILLVVMTTIVLYAGFHFSTSFLLQRKAWDTSSYLNFFTSYYSPNLKIDSSSGSDFYSDKKNYNSGALNLSYYKPLGNYRVAYGEQTVNFGLTITSLVMPSPNSLNNFPQQKSLELFDPNTRYVEAQSHTFTKDSKNGGIVATMDVDTAKDVPLPQELNKITRLENQIVEVGLSFTKPLSYQAVTELVPDTLAEEWAYLTIPNQPQQNVEEYYENDPQFYQSQNWGIGLVTEDNQRDFAKAYQYFEWSVADLKKESKKKSATEHIFKDKDLLALLEENKDLKPAEIKLNGIVLSGRASDFTPLVNHPMIRASSLGVSTTENLVVPYENK